MSISVTERLVTVADTKCRVWEGGGGEPLAVLGGLGGVPRWTPFLERLAGARRVVVLSPPGFPGSGDGHHRFDTYLEWITATQDLIEAAGVAGADVLGASVGGLLAAEVASLCRHSVGDLVLVSPFGLYQVDDPGEDPFAQAPTDIPAVRSADPARYAEAFAPPEAEDEATAWIFTLMRAEEAAARILWPFGDRGIARRLHRITHRTMLVWGEQDRVLPPSYADRWAKLVGGEAQIQLIPEAGHLACVDQPDAVADLVLRFLA
jgi:pimeloyl-ACP methyl ester carboxylesterase